MNPYRFIYPIAWVFFNLVHPVRAIGLEHIPTNGAVLCSNHTCQSDPLLIIFAMGQKSRLKIMAKQEIRKWPVVGWILDKVDLMIWVKRGKSDIGAIKNALKALKDQRPLLIFPEGTRHDEIGEGKTGAAMLAIRGGVPIVPIYIPAKKKWFRRTPVVFGEAYQPFTEDRKANAEDYKMVTEDMMQRIAALKGTLP